MAFLCDAVKTKWGDFLQFPSPLLTVYELPENEALDEINLSLARKKSPGDPVPPNSVENPLVVVTPKPIRMTPRTEISADGTNNDAKDRGRRFLDSIKNPIEEIDGRLGMRVIQNVTSLESGVESNVIIRNVTEPFWRECIDVVTKPSVKYRVCALGTPGIGKTKTTAYLIKMLLDRKETVVYRVCSENYFWEFR